MTPEKARAIDRAEFEADCRAARERAHALVADRRTQRDERVRLWLGKEPPKAQPLHPLRRYPTKKAKAEKPAARERKPRTNTLRLTNEAQITLNYRGNTMNLREWGEALGISPRTLRSRIAYGWPVERILTEPADRCRVQRQKREPKPGVASDFPDIPATGAPSNARDFSQLEISE